MIPQATEIQTDIRRMKEQLQEIENKLYLLTVQKEEEVTDDVPWEQVREGFADRARANLASIILWTKVIDSDVGIDCHQRFRAARTYGLIRPIEREEVYRKLGLCKEVDIGTSLGLDGFTAAYRIADILEDRGNLERVTNLLINRYNIIEYGFMYYDVSACNVSADVIAKRIERDSAC
jgi:hypothetical protein